jgi:predicted nucleic acid-binding protein
MVKALVDTSVIVDMIRGYLPAQNWYLSQSDLGLSRGVWLEVMEGVENSRAQRDALKLLRRFELVELTTADTIWATQQLITFYLSHNIDAFDCLIASASFRLQLPLYTRNLKHFTPLIGSLAQRPF